jgi:threonine dehydrogenase-like Zn-dependent dehydrogenase
VVKGALMEDTMLAAVYEGDGAVAVRSLSAPEPGPDEVVLEISHCGICGSDLHFVVEGWSSAGSVHGHEYSGTIVATGPGVTDWAPGDRAVGGPGPGCGSCAPCLTGTAQLCLQRDQPGRAPSRGAWARYKLLRADHLHRVPDGLDLRTAALTEPLAVALRGVRRSGVRPGGRALVCGAGPIGLLSVAVLRALDVDDVTVSEPSSIRRQLALAVGATAVVTPDELDQPTSPTALVAHPFDAAIECSGRADAIVAALAQLGRRGVLVLSGTGMQRPPLEFLRVILNELVITGALEYTGEDFADAIALLAGGRLPTDRLIEAEDVPLGGVQRAVQRLAAGEIAGKVMVVPRG